MHIENSKNVDVLTTEKDHTREKLKKMEHGDVKTNCWLRKVTEWLDWNSSEFGRAVKVKLAIIFPIS